MPRIVRIPGIMSGQPCIYGTRVLAASVAPEWATEETLREIYPTLPPGAVAAVEHWQQVCRFVELDHGVPFDAVISYTYGEIDVHRGHAGFAVLFEQADGSTQIAPYLGTAREWRTRDPVQETARLIEESKWLENQWIERKRLAALQLSEADYAASWEAWQDIQPPQKYDIYWDGGYLEPIAMKIKHRISSWISNAMQDREIDDATAAKMAKVHPHEIELMRRGIVRHFEVYDLIWVASRLGMCVKFDTFDHEDGGIWI